MGKFTQGNNRQIWERDTCNMYHGNKENYRHGCYLKKYTLWDCQVDMQQDKKYNHEVHKTGGLEIPCKRFSSMQHIS